jgi:gliding motility-associated-like protein
LWRTSSSEFIDTTSSVFVTPARKTTYTVYGYDECLVDSATVDVEVIFPDFFVPNLITPNGDGLNDRFVITDFGQKWNLEVYNRWGDRIYKQEKYINEWNASGQTDGIYFYHILDTKTGREYKGWVEVLR